jgi:hypothetical protein
MPILDASALEDDPEGVALLRDVLGPPKPRQDLGRRFDPVTKASSAMASGLSGPRCVGDGGRGLAGLAGVAPCRSPGAADAHGSRNDGGLPLSAPRPSGRTSSFATLDQTIPSRPDRNESPRQGLKCVVAG